MDWLLPLPIRQARKYFKSPHFIQKNLKYLLVPLSHQLIIRHKVFIQLNCVNEKCFSKCMEVISLNACCWNEVWKCVKSVTLIQFNVMLSNTKLHDVKCRSRYKVTFAHAQFGLFTFSFEKKARGKSSIVYVYVRIETQAILSIAILLVLLLTTHALFQITVFKCAFVYQLAETECTRLIFARIFCLCFHFEPEE